MKKKSIYSYIAFVGSRSIATLFDATNNNLKIIIMQSSNFNLRRVRKHGVYILKLKLNKIHSKSQSNKL